jgi:hypothetical protein
MNFTRKTITREKGVTSGGISVMGTVCAMKNNMVDPWMCEITGDVAGMGDGFAGAISGMNNLGVAIGGDGCLDGGDDDAGGEEDECVEHKNAGGESHDKDTAGAHGGVEEGTAHGEGDGARMGKQMGMGESDGWLSRDGENGDGEERERDVYGGKTCVCWRRIKKWKSKAHGRNFVPSPHP